MSQDPRLMPPQGIGPQSYTNHHPEVLVEYNPSGLDDPVQQSQS